MLSKYPVGNKKCNKILYNTLEYLAGKKSLHVTSIREKNIIKDKIKDPQILA